MADEATDEPVSRQSFERVKRDLEKAQAAIAERDATLAQTTQVIKDVALIDTAYATFKGIEGVADPYALARAAVRDVNLKSAPEEEYAEKLQGWYQEQRALWGTPQSPAQALEPPAELAPTPGFARPSPASTGTPPAPDRLSATGPEIKQLMRDNNRAEIERLDREGKIAWSPLVQDSYGQQR